MSSTLAGVAASGAMEMVGLVAVRKVPPRLRLRRAACGRRKTLRPLIAHHEGWQATRVNAPRAEIALLNPKADVSMLKMVNRWLHRDEDRCLPSGRTRR
jgi:uncharacterized protein (UPF0261 family)